MFEGALDPNCILLDPAMNETFLCEYWFMQLAGLIFFTNEWCWSAILESHSMKQLMRLTDMQLTGVVCANENIYKNTWTYC